MAIGQMPGNGSGHLSARRRVARSSPGIRGWQGILWRAISSPDVARAFLAHTLCGLIGLHYVGRHLATMVFITAIVIYLSFLALPFWQLVSGDSATLSTDPAWHCGTHQRL